MFPKILCLWVPPPPLSLIFLSLLVWGNSDDRKSSKVLAAIRDTPNYDAHVAKQGQAVKSMVAEINEDEAVEVSSLVCSVGFPSHIESMIIDAMHIGGLERSGDKPLQKWEQYMSYIPQSKWDKLREDGITGSQILNVLVAFLVSIGLRHPSCPTFGAITCLYCWLSYGEDVVMKMSKMEKWQEVWHVKKYFRNRIARAEACASPLILPPQPSEFMKSWPSIASVYKGDPPVACPLDADLLMALSDTFPLRKPKHGNDDLLSNPSQAVVPAGRSQLDGTTEQGIMMLMQMNNQLLRQLAQDRCNRPMDKGDECDLTILPPVRTRLKNVIADGPPPAQPALTETMEHKKKKKKHKKKKKKKRLALAASTDTPTPVVKDTPSATVPTLKDMPTQDARGASGSILESLLSRDEAKKKADQLKKAAAKAAEKKASKTTAAAGAQINTGIPLMKRPARKFAGPPPLGCSKCRYLAGGCGTCRGVRAEWEASKKKKVM